MIDPEKAKISIKFVESDGPVKALVSFKQGHVRLSGFRIKDGPYGLWLEPPMIGTGLRRLKAYFDEDKERYLDLQGRVVEEYKKRIEPSSQEINIDDIDFPEPNSHE